MKRTDLTALIKKVLESEEADRETAIKEAIDSIMNINGTDINNTKSQFDATVNENEDLKNQVLSLNSKLATYGDYEDLKNQVNTYKEKEVNTSRMDFLKESKCKNPELFMNMIDWSKGNIVDGKLTGLEEDIKSLQEKYKDNFIVEQENNQTFPTNIKSKETPANKFEYTMEDLRKL